MCNPRSPLQIFNLNLFRVITKICINIAVLILPFYFVLENCVFYVTMKKENGAPGHQGRILEQTAVYRRL